MNNLEAFNDFLKLCVDNCPAPIKESMEYALFPGGKRIRPIFAIAVCQMLSGDIAQVLPYAAAIELIHSYSLVHDDLPAMDNADSRRGKPSLHKAFGENIAVLAGDALLNLAYETMLNHSNADLRIMRKVAYFAGVHGIISGQILDISANKPKNNADVLKLYELKTASLFQAAFYAGAASANASDEVLDDMLEIGKNIGIYFQVQDDLLDSDILIEVLGQNNSEAILGELMNNTVSAIKKYGHHHELLKIIQNLNNRKV